MQHSLTISEACSLLDRVLVTLNNLNQARASFQESEKIEEVQTTAVVMKDSPTAQKEPEKTSKSSVLTIKLADLIREGDAARARRGQHVSPQRPVRPPPVRLPLPRVTPPLREVRMVEVLYKRQRLAS